MDGTKENIAAKSTIARTTYYPNPVPNAFYTGNTEEEPLFGKVQNYYAFTWGDALFVSIDPYRYSSNAASEDLKGDGWGWTLGKEQYDWFRQTLEQSNAKYKFVFSHHAIGNVCGGAKVAKLYEWGGKDEQGVDKFAAMRPGWEMPIHDLLVQYDVDVVFHGHDHFYAEQEKDGIVYQLVPQPGSLGNSVNDAITYGYESGIRLPSAGFIRVVVGSDKATVEYVKTEADGSYTIPHVYSVPVTR